MDEPFSAMDPLIRRGLQDEFQELSRTMEKITIFITHDLDEAMRMGSRIGIMRDGEMVKIGTPEDIIIHPKDGYVADFVQDLSRLKLVLPTGLWNSQKPMTRPMATLLMWTHGPRIIPRLTLILL